MLIDDLGESCFTDDLGATSWVDDLGQLLQCDGSIDGTFDGNRGPLKIFRFK